MKYLKKIGKIKRFRKTRSGHYIGLLKSGRYVHFKAKNPKVITGPWWRQILFRGCFEVLPRQEKRHALQGH